MTDYPQKTWRDYVEEGKYYYDEAAAHKAVEFVEELCTHAKAEWGGKSIILEEWQKEQFYYPLFGIKRESDGLRRFRRAWLELPRKNGKSLMLVPLLLYMLCADGEPGAECYCAAAEKEQARLIHDVAKAMIRQNPILKAALRPFQNSITYPKSNSSLKVLSADADTKHGYSGHGIVIDEVHVQPNMNLVDVLQTSTGSRRQPIVAYITTAGVVGTAAHLLHMEAESVLRGQTKDDALLPVIFGALETDDEFDPEVWKKANPNLGVAKKWDYMEGEAQKAKNRPSYRNTFRQLDLNIWTEGLTAWLTPELIQLGSGDAPTREKLKGCNAWLGMDLATINDIAAKMLLVEKDDKLYLLTSGYIPEASIIIKAEQENLNVQPWVDAGILTACPGTSISFATIEADIRQDFEDFNIQKFGYDGWQAADMVQRLMNDLGDDQFLKVAQTTAGLDYPTRTFEAGLLAGDFRHGDNPLWIYAAKNAVLYTDAEGKVRVSKKENRRKIDPLVATINAVAAMIKWKGEQEEAESYFDKTGEFFSF